MRKRILLVGVAAWMSLNDLGVLAEPQGCECDRIQDARSRADCLKRCPSPAVKTPIGGQVQLTPEQRTRIREAVTKSQTKSTSVQFDVRVGVQVPRTVKLLPVPNSIASIEPSWRGYAYAVVGDAIVIVEPRSQQIVAVLEL